MSRFCSREEELSRALGNILLATKLLREKKRAKYLRVLEFEVRKCLRLLKIIIHEAEQDGATTSDLDTKIE